MFCSVKYISMKNTKFISEIFWLIVLITLLFELNPDKNELWLQILYRLLKFYLSDNLFKQHPWELWSSTYSSKKSMFHESTTLQWCKNILVRDPTIADFLKFLHIRPCARVSLLRIVGLSLSKWTSGLNNGILSLLLL